MKLIIGIVGVVVLALLIARERFPGALSFPVAPESAATDSVGPRHRIAYGEPRARSVLNVPPAEMRDVVREFRRVRPDRRVLLAIADVHHILTGAPPSVVHADWAGDQWQIAYGDSNTSVGSLAELASLADARALLASWALAVAGGQLLTTAPGNHALAADVRPSLDSLSAPAAIAALARLDVAWKTTRDPRLLPLAAEALAILAVLCEDRADLADALHARALAASAAARAFSSTPPRPADALLSLAMGYLADARDSAAALGRENPVVLFIAQNDSALTRIATDRGDALARFLAISRAAEGGLVSWLPARQSLGRWPGNSTASLKTALASGEFGLEAEAPSRVPAAVFSELDDLARNNGTIGRMLGRVKRRLDLSGPFDANDRGHRLGSASDLTSLERRLQELGARFAGPFVDSSVVSGYYRGFYYSALHGAAEFGLERLSSVSRVEDLSDRMKGDLPSGPAADFARWLQHLVAAKKGQTHRGNLTNDATASQWLGQRQRAMAFVEVERGLSFNQRPSIMVTGRGYAKWLDARPSHVRALARLAHSSTYDVTAADIYYRAVAAREGDTDPYLAPWIARFLRDTTRLLRMIDDSTAPAALRVEAARQVALDSIVAPSYLRPRFERLVELEPDEWSTRAAYIEYLRMLNDHESAEQTAREWISEWGSTSGSSFDRANARVELSRALDAQKRFREAWEAIEPAVESYQGNAFRQGVTVLSHLGRLAEARAIAQRMVGRYPDSRSGHVAMAEVSWRANEYEAAARQLYGAAKWIDMWTFRGEIARSFADVFGGRSTDDATLAANALAAAGIPQWQIGQLGIGLLKLGRSDLAFAVHSQASEPTGAGGMFVPMQPFESLRAWRGDDAALSWLRSRVRAGVEGPMAMILYQGRAFNELWSLDPPGRRYSSFTWLMRAAASAASPEVARRHGAELRAHFQRRSGDAYHVMGQYVMGLVSDDDMLALATSPDHRCEVAYYMGVRALAERRAIDAADWFLVAAETRQTNEGELIWSMQQLSEWANSPRTIAGRR